LITPSQPHQCTESPNNLARHYPADLSNERGRDVIARRTVLVSQIRDIIAARLGTRPI
jgi:hypothetical protein